LGGKKAVVKLLLETGSVKVYSRDNYSRTALSCAGKQFDELYDD
jgi:hypothetical protein